MQNEVKPQHHKDERLTRVKMYWLEKGVDPDLVLVREKGKVAVFKIWGGGNVPTKEAYQKEGIEPPAYARSVEEIERDLLERYNPNFPELIWSGGKRYYQKDKEDLSKMAKQIANRNRETALVATGLREAALGESRDGHLDHQVHSTTVSQGASGARVPLPNDKPKGSDKSWSDTEILRANTFWAFVQSLKEHGTNPITENLIRVMQERGVDLETIAHGNRTGKFVGSGTTNNLKSYNHATWFTLRMVFELAKFLEERELFADSRMEARYWQLADAAIHNSKLIMDGTVPLEGTDPYKKTSYMQIKSGLTPYYTDEEIGEIGEKVHEKAEKTASALEGLDLPTPVRFDESDMAKGRSLS